MTSSEAAATTPVAASTPWDVASEFVELQYAFMGLVRTAVRRRVEGGVTPAQMPILFHLRREPGVSLSDLATHMGLTPPSVSRLVEVLVGRGIVERRQGSDRRFVELHLTEAGMAVLDRFSEAKREVLAQRLEGLPAEDYARIAATLRQLRAVLTSDEGERA